MVRKTGLALLLVLFLLFACAGVEIQPEKLYKGILQNNTDMVVHVAVVKHENEPNGEPIEVVGEFMLAPMEMEAIDLPAGHYHVYASCSKGYFKKCLVLPDMLGDPDLPWKLTFRMEKPRGA
jgi:hypothetical protein